MKQQEFKPDVGKPKSRRKWNVVLCVLMGIVCFFLLVFVLTVVDRYTDTVEDKISDKARLYSTSTNEVISDYLAEYEGSARFAAGALREMQDSNDFQTMLKRLSSNNNEMHSPNTIRFVKDGKLYNSDGRPNADGEGSMRDLVEKASSGNTAAYGSVYDSENKMQLLAFYAPVTGNENADAVVLYYAENTVLEHTGIQSKDTDTENAEFILLCSKRAGGRVVQMIYPNRDSYEGSFPVEENDRINALITKYVTDTEARDTLLGYLDGGEGGAVTFSMDSERYAMSVVCNRACEDFAVVTLYRAGNLDKNGTALASVGAMLVILCLSIPTVFLGILAFWRQRDKQQKHAKNYDETMQCHTLSGMEELIPKRVAEYPGSSFAVVGGRLKHYQYLKANYPEVAESMLMQVRRLLDTTLAIGEVVGLGNESEFILLLHYRDTQSLTTRLYKLSDFITNNIGNNQYNVHLDFGVYEIEKDTKDSASQMIDNAFSVIESDSSNAAVTTVSVYNVIFRENYMKNAEVEVKMDYALQHDEFKVFFQPKINSDTGSIDGCEALVRWWDPETGKYRAPGTFMPLFEQNGFVIKLDRYVFYKVCEFIGSRVSRHLPIFPTSVNVSRVSAINAEFLEYYTSVKKQFNVPDDFLTLELTESIASSSYETLNRMSVAFHKARFLLSIDDFGSGYSSMNVLKNVVVDEIKMDRIFLDAGVSEERDRTIMASIVRLANDLGIKVVQEGVETEEQLAIVREAGCRIIQGFYYSKPLSIPEYINFVNMKMDEENRKARQRTFRNMDDDLPEEERPENP